jgi:hypothetical protein
MIYLIGGAPKVVSNTVGVSRMFANDIGGVRSIPGAFTRIQAAT